VSGLRIPGEVLISVEDNGIGIPAERARQVFELFRPLHGGPCFPAGMGIGLALARRVVHLNGGRIWCETSQTGGARISFTLPGASDEQDAPARP
jgi:signal transduction histidine kinase